MNVNRAECYSIVLQNTEEVELQIGRLGFFILPRGYYVYTGRAKRGIHTRIERHLQRQKKKRWHIDYITTECGFEVKDVILHPVSADMECSVNQWILKRYKAVVPIPGFGGSDCMNRCPGHLLYFDKQPRVKPYNHE